MAAGSLLQDRAKQMQDRANTDAAAFAITASATEQIGEPPAGLGSARPYGYRVELPALRVQTVVGARSRPDRFRLKIYAHA